MSGRLHIRGFVPGDEAALRGVFMSSIHGLASGFYSREQLAVWAPQAHDALKWARRMEALRPFVATLDGRVAGYADLQGSGLIDHFFVSADFARRGVGSALMRRVLDEANARGPAVLTAHVSLAAEDFFARHGFKVVRRQTVTVAGVTLANALMERRCGSMPESGSRD